MDRANPEAWMNFQQAGELHGKTGIPNNFPRDHEALSRGNTKDLAARFADSNTYPVLVLKCLPVSGSTNPFWSSPHIVTVETLDTKEIPDPNFQCSEERWYGGTLTWAVDHQEDHACFSTRYLTSSKFITEFATLANLSDLQIGALRDFLKSDSHRRHAPSRNLPLYNSIKSNDYFCSPLTNINLLDTFVAELELLEAPPQSSSELKILPRVLHQSARDIVEFRIQLLEFIVGAPRAQDQHGVFEAVDRVHDYFFPSQKAGTCQHTNDNSFNNCPAHIVHDDIGHTRYCALFANIFRTFVEQYSRRINEPSTYCYSTRLATRLSTSYNFAQNSDLSWPNSHRWEVPAFTWTLHKPLYAPSALNIHQDPNSRPIAIGGDSPPYDSGNDDSGDGGIVAVTSTTTVPARGSKRPRS
jgi:hypothetical protein